MHNLLKKNLDLKVKLRFKKKMYTDCEVGSKKI